VISIPDISIQTSSGQYLYITDAYCYNISIDSIPSSYEPPSTLSVEIYDASLFCIGNYKYEIFKGSVTVLISNVMADMSIDVEKDDEYPSGLNVTSCSVIEENVDVKFDGNIGTNILNLLSTALEKAIKQGIQKFVCVKLVDIIVVNGTNAILNTIDPTLQHVVNSQPASLPIYGSEMISWNSIYDLTESVISCIAYSHPQLIEYVTRPVINELINSLTDGTDDITIPIGQTTTYLNNTVTLNTVTISDLNTFESVKILKPSMESNVTIVSSISLSHIMMTLNVTYKSLEIEGYEEELSLVASLSNIVLTADTAIVINMQSLQSLYVDQMSELSCLLSATELINITSLLLNATVDYVIIEEVKGKAGELEMDVAALVNNTLKLMTEEFGLLLTDVISGLSQGYLRPLLNDKIQTKIQDLIKSEPCVHVIATSDESIVWSNSSIVRLVNNVVNDIVGANGLNTLLSCATNGTGSISVDLSHGSVLEIDGLNSLKYISILDAYPEDAISPKPYNLMNRILLGSCNSEECLPLSISITHTTDSELYNDKTIDMTSSLMNAYNNISSISMSLELSNLYMYVNVLAEVSKYLLSELQVSELTTKGCLGSTIEMLSISQLSLGVSEATLKLNRSSSFHDITSLVTDMFMIISTTAGLDVINTGIAKSTSDASMICNNISSNSSTTDDSSGQGKGGTSSSSESSSSPDWITPLIISGSLVGLMTMFWVYNRKCSKGFDIDTKMKEEIRSLILSESNEVSKPWWRRWSWEGSLVLHRSLPLWLRVLLVVGCLANFALYVDSNQEPSAAAVIVELMIGNQSKKFNIFQMGLVTTVDDSKSLSNYQLICILTCFVI
jgi:hypothetical protein